MSKRDTVLTILLALAWTAAVAGSFHELGRSAEEAKCQSRVTALVDTCLSESSKRTQEMMDVCFSGKFVEEK